jgi:hypothetical protein
MQGMLKRQANCGKNTGQINRRQCRRMGKRENRSGKLPSVPAVQRMTTPAFLTTEAQSTQRRQQNKEFGSCLLCVLCASVVKNPT